MDADRITSKASSRRASAVRANSTESAADSSDWTGVLAALEAVPHPCLAADIAGNLRGRNAAAAEFLPPRATVESVFAAFQPPAPFAGWEIELQRAAQDGSAVWRRVPHVPIAGATSTWDIHLRRLRPAAEREGEGVAPAGFILTLIDATALVELERQLAAHERLLSIGRLAAKVAHELNNPLDGILRYLGLARKLVMTEGAGAAGPAPAGAGGPSLPARVEKAAAYLDEARAGLLRMAKIIRELLAFSRRSPGGAEELGVNEVVEQAIRAISPRADDQGVLIAADFQDRDMPALPGGRLLQVCLNLLKNALDAMPRGGRLMISTGVVGDEVVLRFADTGPGLPADASRLFEPFNTTKPPGEGTGLGLAICKDIVEGMGGGIEAARGEEAGAVFTVKIPRARGRRKANGEGQMTNGE
ncbi:MAG: hypothetical protein IT449_10660 [Phycisphaerales bacterium]|nr:hypothetical protein [Phycisphaerales bacterium]